MTTTYPPFPDLGEIAFRREDPSDHVGGGHCAGLPDTGAADQWLELLDQHHRALNLLVDQALADEDGWALPRPLLFAAHHTCEVALKAALAALPGSPTYDSHHLPNLWNQLAGKQGLHHLTEQQRREAKAFLDALHDLTPDGFTARYPLSMGDMCENWCCLNPEAIRAGVAALLARLLPV